MGVVAAVAAMSCGIAQGSPQDKAVFFPGSITGGVSQDSGARLMDPAVFDFDGDGIDDMVFGAPGMSPNGIASAGSVYIISGKKGLELKGKRETSLKADVDWRFDGHTPNGQLGMSLYTGDFNGDGKTDLAVAQPGRRGSIFIIYGGKKLEKGIYDIAQQGVSDVSFTGPEQSVHFGISGCVGDFNGDGLDDLALSSIASNPNDGNNSSRMTIVPMRGHWEKRQYDLSGKFNGKTVLSRPVSAATRVVHTCAAGDFNDDGIVDIALGMPFDSHNREASTGSVTIIHSPYKYHGTTIDLGKVDSKLGYRIYGDQAGAQFGHALAAADFTGDGRTDLAVSAPDRLISGPQNEGMVYIIDGNALPYSGETQSPDWLSLRGNGGKFGYRLSVSDINADKRPDLVVSSPWAGQLEDGALSIWFGSPHFSESVKRQAKADIEITGSDFMGFGIGAAFGDFNGDGKQDALIRTTADPQGRPSTGAMAVLADIAQMPRASTLGEDFLTIAAPAQGGGLSAHVRRIEIAQTPYDAWLSPRGMGNRSVLCLVKEQREDVIDAGISGACDIQIIGPENETISDYAITLSPARKPRLTIALPRMRVKNSTGIVAVMDLPEDLSSPLALNLNEKTLASNAQVYHLDAEAESGLGTRIEWHDVDGDGLDDLLIGAPGRMIDTDKAGSLFIVKGSAKKANGFYSLTDKSVIEYDGFLDEQIGAQWLVADFNGDGQKDIAVMAKPTAFLGEEAQGRVYIIFSAMQKSANKHAIRTPETGALQIVAQSQTALEIVPQAVDLNGDGLEDLVLVSPDYRAGLQKEGAVYGIYGNRGLKAGILDLSNSALAGFMMTASRNEKLRSVSFFERNGTMRMLVTSSEITFATVSHLNGYEAPADGIFSGVHTTGQMPKFLQTVTFPNPAQWLVRDDAHALYGDLWILEPYEGARMSGQGIARKVRLETKADKR